MKVSELRADLDALSRNVKTEFEAVDRRFDAIDARFDTLKHEIRDEITREGASTRRHFDVVAESMKADIALFMTRVATLDERVAVVRSEQTTHKAALENHEVRLQALERPRG